MAIFDGREVDSKKIYGTRCIEGEIREMQSMIVRVETYFYSGPSVGVAHNLGLFPHVSVMDAEGVFIQPSGYSIVHSDENTYTITFEHPVASGLIITSL